MNKMRKVFMRRILAGVVSVCVLMCSINITAFAAEDINNYNRQTDLSTMNTWESLFMDSDTSGVDFTTENAGGVWTDKSVFLTDEVPTELTDATSLENTHLRITDTADNFLVALSAIASNKEIVGYSTIPTDTVFVLDLSSSMRTSGDNRTSAIDDLVDATNKAITDLLALNKNNRIAVVMYAGNVNGSFSSADGTTVVLMPLDSYTPATTSNGVGQYLESTTYSGNRDWAIRIRNGVRDSQGNTISGTKNTGSGTYMQDGVYEAMKVLLGAETTIASGVQAGVDRKPIMLIMTDGESTLANNDYDGNDALTNLGNSVMYNFEGSNNSYNHRDSIAFMTMLTTAFAKKQIENHYDTDALFYTLAYGEQVNTLDEAISVMNPERTSAALNRFWTPFLNGQSVEVYRSGNTRLYTQNSNDNNKRLTAEDKLYVDEFFPANTDAQLATAFEAIVEQIKIQSKYYPTYVETDHDHDGYITFTDKIGGYMEVKEIKGFVIGDHYFSGATLSKGFVEDNSIFGTIDNPNALGDNLVWSVKERLGIADTGIARQLIQNAFDNKQLSYTSTIEFSNYIGWYSDENGNYLDFWHEGLDVSNAPSGATHIIKSYGFLGETDEVHGISDTDMLYASVRLSTELEDYDNDGIAGETMLTWQLPASLIPTITYNVDVTIDSDGNITGVRNVALENENVKPIRLLYEVALRSDIYDWNVAEKVNDGYKNSTANKDAGYVFYTNQWNKPVDSNDTSYRTATTRNTYSHFEPSVENERYYYTENSIIYTDTNGTEYNGNQNTPPNENGIYYRSFNVYEKMNNGTFRMHTHYERISQAALSELTAEDNFVNGNWVIRKGVIHRYLDDYVGTKTSNATNTSLYYNFPSVQEQSDRHDYHSYSTLGNNGKLTVTPATGIKVTKTLEEAVEGATNNFEFKITGGSGNAIIVRVDENGNEVSRTPFTFANGEATFNLAAGETVYIIGLEDGVQYTISESVHEQYSLVSVAVNGTAEIGDAAVVTVADQTIQTAEFINGPKRDGNLYIIKEIVSDHNIPQNVLAEEFEIEIKVDVEGEYDIRYLEGNTIQTLKAKVDSSGYLKVDNQNLKITAERAYGIMDLPHGARVEVREILSSEQSYFKAAIKTRDYTGAEQDNDGIVTITGDANSTAVITNTYTPVSVDVDLDIAGTKVFTVESPLANALTFEFAVQKYDETANKWVDISNEPASVTSQGTSTGDIQTFTIENVLSGETYDKVGAYAYQVIEVIPEVKADGVTYDRTLYTFTVNVTDNGGRLQAVVRDHTNTEITDSYAVRFENTYHTAPISIDIKKTVENLSGEAEISAAGFTFKAVETDERWNPQGEISRETTDGVGEARFAMTYDEADKDYHYIIEEVIPAGAVEITQGTHAGKKMLDGWIYDTTKYYVKVSVEQQGTDGNLVATVQTATDPNNLSGSTDEALIEFENIYDPADAELDLNGFVSKELKGRALNAGEFTFHVTENGKSYANSAANRRLTGTNAADGKVTFVEKLVFDKVGTYKFDITEVMDDANKLGGVTYDRTTYDLVIEVTDNNGALEARAYFEDSVSREVTFHNTYDASGEVVIAGTKTLSGRPIVNGEFHFTLTEVTDATGATIVQNGVSLRAENGPTIDNGRTAEFKFPSIRYTLNDVGKTFYYLIEEVNAGKTINGVIHDDQKYVVAVEVSDNGDGTLKTVANAGVNEIVYSNEYIPQSIKVNLGALKVLDGRDLRADEFSFSIKETESNFTTLISGGVSETVTNNINGVVHFSEIELKVANVYYFVVEEILGNVSGVSYDDTKYHVQITVTDDGMGRLVSQTAITMLKVDSTSGQNSVVETPVSSMIFNNIYNTPDILIEKMQVVGEGKTLADATKETLAVKAGDIVTYYITVANKGDGYAKDLTITDKIPEGLTLVEGSISGNGTEKDGVITWNFGELAAGTDLVVNFSVKVPEVKETTQWKNIGTVKYYEPDDTPKEEESNEVVFEEKVVKEEENNVQSTVSAPKTGDTTSTAMWSTLAFASLMVCGALLVIEKKRRNEI